MLPWISIASVFGFLSVALGAFGAHALKERFDAYAMGVYQTGVQYQMIHSVALLALALAMHASPALAAQATARGAAFCFATGMIVFSGSLYALAFSGVKLWGAVTPIGGLFFLVGWFCLAIAGWKVAS